MPRIDLPSLLERARAAPADAGLAARAVSLVDLTSLKGDESAADIEALCRRAVSAGTAAVCIHAPHVPTAKRALAGSAVRLATVANFPHGGDDIGAVADEVAAAVAAGADEVDVVAPIHAALEGDVELVGELVQACRGAAGPDVTLKVILETGVLGSPELITAAARAAVMAGADFLKTSTGKAEVGATLEAAALLLTVVDEAGGRVGLKVAGGVRTAADAAGYLLLVDAVMGPSWAAPATFRLGASALLDDLLRLTGRGSGAGPGEGGGY